MKITKRKLRKLILESINMKNHDAAMVVNPLTIVTDMVVEILQSFEEMGYTINEVPMWEVVSAMTEKIEVNDGILNTFISVLKSLQADPDILESNDYFESSTLIYVLKEAIKGYNELGNATLEEELKRLSYASKEHGFTYGIDHVSKKNKAADDIIGHT